MTHQPHVHTIVPGGFSNDDECWIKTRPNYFLSVLILSRPFPRLMI